MREVLPVDSMQRRRQYTRYSRQSRNKKQSGKGKDDFSKSVLNQVIVCGVILLIVFAIKNIDTPFANKITEQVRNMLGYTIDIEDTYETVETFAQNKGLLPSYKSTLDEPQQKEEGIYHENIESGNKQVDSDNIKITQEMIAPLNGKVVSIFGMRKHPLFKEEFFHSGIDIEGNQGDEFVAVIDGKVVEVEKDQSYGNYIKLKHSDNVYTFYAHGNQILVEEGQQVQKGQVIGNIGQGGQILGTHLHFEIRLNDQVLDPLKYIDLPMYEPIQKQE